MANGTAKGFALALDLLRDYFSRRINHNTSQLRLMRYSVPSAAPEPEQLRAGEHCDLGMMTILIADSDQGGLQVKRRGGGWVDVLLFDYAFTVNIGDLMMR